MPLCSPWLGVGKWPSATAGDGKRELMHPAPRYVRFGCTRALQYAHHCLPYVSEQLVRVDESEDRTRPTNTIYRSTRALFNPNSHYAHAQDHHRTLLFLLQSYNPSHRPQSSILISILIPIWQTIESHMSPAAPPVPYAVDEAFACPCSLSTSISQRTRHEFNRTHSI